MRKKEPAVWAFINLTGLAITVIGMFGIVGLLNFEHAMIVFVFGTVLTFVSMAAIFRTAHKANKIQTPKKRKSDEDEQ